MSACAYQAHPRRPKDRAGEGRPHGTQAEAYAAANGRGAAADRQGRGIDARPRQELRCQRQHDFEADFAATELRQ